MKLDTLLTFFGLLLTAYGATQEYSRLKMKLIPSIFYWISGILSFILFITSFEEVRNYFISDCKFCLFVFIKNEYLDFWEYKYFLLISLFLLSLIVPLMIFTKLRYGNQKKFLLLLHQLSKQENYEFLNRLANENMEKILSLRYKKTFQEQLDLHNYTQFTDSISANKINWIQKMLSVVKLCILKILTLISYDKNLIKQIADFVELEPNIKMNELMGYKKLEKLVELKNNSEKYSKKFISDIFQNQNSFIVKQYLDESNSNEYQKFFKQYCHEVKLNINVGFVILEILKDLEFQKALTEKYDGKNQTVEYIYRLLSVWTENNSSLSNMATTIQKELLKYSKLEDQIETNGFFLLMKLFDSVCEYISKNYQLNNATIQHLNYLYNGMGELFYTATYSLEKRIQIACHYVSFLMRESNFQVEKINTFRQYIQEEPEQISLFVQVLRNRDQTLCKDDLGFGVLEDNANLFQWNEIKTILKMTTKS
ncbi:hypothetical protein [Aliarcobacter butzleri]|uniref:hypothetical protein n=1 Tax=Aliarcobacter butzleri TaxID=28197 RepID=UPI002B252F4C|nr:hypothetical protein [Aliarcobacter butzleri]